MAIGNNAASIAAQVESIRPNLEPLMLLSSVFWGRLEARTDMTPVGSRPTRVPTQPITGGSFSVFNPDGGDMGLGSGPQEVPGYLSCAYYLQASQYTAQSEWATDSSQKAIQDYERLVDPVPVGYESITPIAALGTLFRAFGRQQGVTFRVEVPAR